MPGWFTFATQIYMISRIPNIKVKSPTSRA